MKKEKGNKQFDKKNIAQILVYLFGIILIVGAVIYLGDIFLEYRRGEMEYEALNNLIFEQSDESDKSEESNTDEPEAEDAMAENRAEIDKQVMKALGELKEQNNQVVGWIRFDNMELSYPIMQAEDNDYYLTHTFSGEVNSSGSIFLDMANNSDFEDYHTIIHGHNMKNMSMFGRLKNYKNDNFYDKHQYFTIYTENEVYRYQIFAYYDTSEDSDVYMIGFGPDEVFQEFVNTMKRRSYYDTGVGVTSQDKVITLSTCSDEDLRFIINAKRVPLEY